jgi:hypothetical protein
VADPRDHVVPLALFDRWIIDQDTIYQLPHKVAAIVPNGSVAEAGHDEISRRDSAIRQYLQVHVSLPGSRPVNQLA